MHLIVGAFAVLCGGRTEALGRSQVVRMASAALAGPDGAAVSAADVLRVAEQAGRAAAEVVRNRLGAEVLKTKATRGDLLTEVGAPAVAAVIGPPAATRVEVHLGSCPLFFMTSTCRPLRLCAADRWMGRWSG